MKKLLLTLLIINSSFLIGHSQNWLQQMKDGKTNIHDVQKAFYAWYANHKNDKKEAKGEAKGEDNNYTLYKRWEWLMEARTYPTGNYPDPSVISAQYARLLGQNNTDSKRTHSDESMANWTYQGNSSVPINGGGDGRINHIRFYPGNANIMYACSPTGGLWKSTDGGNTWNNNTDQLTELGTSDLAIDPVNLNIMYLATGDCDGPGADFHSVSTMGILKSTDGGNTWNPSGLSYTQAATGPAYGTVTNLAINPNNTKVINAATSYGMYFSNNSGATWKQADTGFFRSVEMEPFHTSIVYASTENGKFYRSKDSGKTYVQITNGLPASGLAARMTIAVSPADSNYVYVVAEDAFSDSFYGLYRSTDRGQTFTQMSNYSSAGDLSVNYGWYGLPLAVSPTNADTILTGGLDVYLSADGGATWTLNASWTGSGAPYAHADGHHYIFTPGSGASWFDACDGGIFKATNAGAIYTDLSNDLKIAEIYAIGASALTPGLSLTGWQDNGTNESGSPWQQVNGGDGMQPFIDYTNDNTMYSASQDGALYNSFDGGFTWNYISYSIPENGPWLTRWLQDPQAPNTLFAGFSNIWQSTDQGNTWAAISNFSSNTALVYALIVDPVNDNVLYTAWKDSIFYTTNQGTTWKNITANLPVSQAWITGLALDPANSKHAWATFSGYVDSVKVYQTYDGGTTWKNISMGLPNLPVNCILFQTSSHSGIYVGTDCGVYYRDTVLNNWVAYNTGLPNVMVNDLKYDASGALLAATYGRGVWTSPKYITGINEVQAYGISAVLFPNPNKGVFQLGIRNGQLGMTSAVEIYNILGEKIYSSSFTIHNSPFTIDISGRPAGVYMYRLISETGVQIANGKFVIE
ncbi:MAG TPA: T9SS type A sorting domain-containing protein [Bacteroidia bacterium]|jgi:photosystem II stability/assembly factor-like uncharacterized protein|nr:T9SS type A sorting domain-containing protein [Bacteroidia bacterium]